MLLRQAAARLVGAGVPSPPHEARVLLAGVLRTSHAWLLAHPETELRPADRSAFITAVERRVAHEPVAYILGHKEFFGLDLEVSPAVLIPRPETELLVEAGLEEARRPRFPTNAPLRVVDLGTGSGAVAIALAANEPRVQVVAADSSPGALAIVSRNVSRHGLTSRIELVRSDLFDAIPGSFDMVLANLPYIPSAEVDRLMPEVSLYEPRSALDGGPNGTRLIRRALEQAAGRVRTPSSLLFEIGDGQGQALRGFAREIYPEAAVEARLDYAGLERILLVRLG